MNYIIKKQEKNTLEIEVNLPFDELKDFYQKALNDLAEEITIPGFRKGKAPLFLVEKEIDKMKVLEKAAELAINEKIKKIIDQEKLKIIDVLKIEVLKLAFENPLVFRIIALIWPKVKICDFKSIKIKPKEIKVEEKEIDKVLEELQYLKRKETLVFRPARKGDKIEIDLEMFLNKVPIEGGQAKNLSLILGEDFYIPDFSENLIGLKPNETKEFTILYPQNHYDNRLKGKEVEFKVKVNNLYQIDLPEINDEFAKSFEGFTSLVQLREYFRKKLEEEAYLKEIERQEIEMLKQLVEKSQFEEIPEILIENEIDKMIEELKSSLEAQNLKFEDYLAHLKKSVKDLRKEFVPKAEERVKLSLIIKEIIEEQNFDITQKEIENEIEKIFSLYKGDEKLLENLKTEEGKNYLKNLLLNRKAIEYIKSKVDLIS
jgi:trigger factor